MMAANLYRDHCKSRKTITADLAKLIIYYPEII